MAFRHILSLFCLGALTHSFASARTVQDGSRELAVVLAAKRTTSATTVGSYGYIGCWSEPDSMRALPTFSYADDAMTAEMCSTKCAGIYQFWGLEYGRECWCADSITAGSEPTIGSDCNFGCSGNSDETCGAAWRLSVYNASTLIPLPSVAPKVGRYSYVGCQSESPEGTRALNASESTSPVMTNEKCSVACEGYAMFGTEYGRECYCGNDLTPGSLPVDNKSCDMPCVGNSLDLCGSYLKLNLYSAAPTSATLSANPQVSASTSLSSSSMSSATVSTASPLSTSVSVLSISTSFPALVSSTSLYTLSTSTKTSISTTTRSTTVPAADLGASPQVPTALITSSSAQFPISISAIILPTPISAGQHIGCFKDIIGHDMIRLFKNDSMTPELCMEVAKEHLMTEPAITYRYVGLEYGRECYAATSAPSPVPTSLTGRKACTMTCKGNSLEMCGGGMQYNLYASATEKPLSVPVTTSAA